MIRRSGEKMDGPIPTDPKAFASVLKGTTHASEEDMATLNDLIRVFNLKTFRELHDLYLAVDVFGLADVFEEFRNICLRDWWWISRVRRCRFRASNGPWSSTNRGHGS